MKPPELTADGLLLRGWQPDDAEAVHRACQDPDIQRWTTVPSPYLPEHARDFVAKIAPDVWAERSAAPFAVCDAATGELLASCGLVSIDRAGRWAEIGYWTAPWARGRGVAVRAVRAVARWAFEFLDVRRLVWQAEVGNHASRLVALRAGFGVDGRLRLADPHPQGTSDGWIGSLLPPDLDRPVALRRVGALVREEGTA
ncbi:MAG TPA: GNAT family N-acetyltransferase [Micromonosporaceae bacterium]|nr:GNAT family N-acetyltransferase [Micromonosporaceae bacterium]